MSGSEKNPADDFRSGEMTSSGFKGWPEEIIREFRDNEFNGSIGTNLVFENESVRVWHMELGPGERMPVHRHVLTYFWTALTPGRFLQRTHDGAIYESDYPAGETHFYDLGESEFALHNLENIGDTTMSFVAVELKKESKNKPLPVKPGSQFPEVPHSCGESPKPRPNFREEFESRKAALRKDLEERRKNLRQGQAKQ